MNGGGVCAEVEKGLCLCFMYVFIRSTTSSTLRFIHNATLDDACTLKLQLYGNGGCTCLTTVLHGVCPQSLCDFLIGYTWRRLCTGTHDCGVAVPLPRSRHSSTAIRDSMFVFAGESALFNDFRVPSFVGDGVPSHTATFRKSQWRLLSESVIGVQYMAI